MDDDSQNQSSPIEIVMREGIRLFVVAEIKRFLLSHEVHRVRSETDKDKFHDEEIKGSPNEEQVNISGDEDN